MSRRHILVLIGLAACLWLAVEARAHSGATDIVKQRMDAMSTMAKAMKAVADMVKGKTPFEPPAVAPVAEILIRHAVEIPALFPDTELSRNGKTEAQPVVWTRWERFAELAGRLELQGAALRASAESGDRSAITRQFITTVKICRDCHSDFRKPKD